MPASPWRTLESPEPERDYVALLSYLPLKSYWRIPHFFLYTAQVTKQLASADGVLGFSVLSRPPSKRFWTLSAWKNEAALRTFVQHPPHVRIMTALTPHMGKTNFGSSNTSSWSQVIGEMAGGQHRVDERYEPSS